MTEELQDTTQEENTETLDSVNVDGQEEGVDAAPEIDQEAVNRRIGEKHRLQKVAENELKVVRQELDQLKAQSAKTSAPVVAQMPDQFDDDFPAKMAVYEASVVAKANHDRDKSDILTLQNNQLIADQNKVREAANQSVDKFNTRIKELGLDSAHVDTAAGTVSSYGIGGDLGVYILNDEDGPLIVNYLASNLDKLESLSGMPPVDAAVLIATTIKPEAQKLKPKQTETPDPALIINGKGSPQKERGPAGARFE